MTIPNMKLTDYDALVCLQLKDNGWKCHINVTFYVCLCTDADQAKEVSFWLACMFDHHQFLALCFVMLPVGQCLFISFVMLYIFIGVSFHYENLNLMHSPYHPPQPTLPYEVSWRYVAWTLLCKHHLWWIFFFKEFCKASSIVLFWKMKNLLLLLLTWCIYISGKTIKDSSMIQNVPHNIFVVIILLSTFPPPPTVFILSIVV